MVAALRSLLSKQTCLHSVERVKKMKNMGVVYLLGIVSWDLGFVVMRIQEKFPDCEAIRKIDDQHWQFGKD
jgi:hypothetical protein